MPSEKNQNLVFNSSVPNCLYAEMTNPEIEFPNNEMTEEELKQQSENKLIL